MAIQVRELGQSRSLSDGLERSRSGTLRYLVTGTTEVSSAESAVIAAAPATFEGMLPDSYEISVANDTGTAWEVEVHYNRRRVPVGEYSISFSTTGGTVHITQSLDTTRYPSDAPDYGGAILVNDDKQVEGVDIVIPTCSLNVRANIPGTYITAAYIQTLTELTGRVNSTSFLGYAAGEVLFLGAQGEYRLGEDLQLSFEFAVSKNVTGLTLGSIENIAKLGHQHLWVKYEKEPDTTNDPPSLVTKPQAVYVETVYGTADLNLLMIGVA